jgi:hypothetical protein
MCSFIGVDPPFVQQPQPNDQADAKDNEKEEIAPVGFIE